MRREELDARSEARVEIRGARIVDPASKRDAPGSIFIAGGRIASLDRAPDGFVPDETLDAHGLIACPGLVDLSARPSPVRRTPTRRSTSRDWWRC